MSVISDKLKSTIQSVFDLPKEKISKKVDMIVNNTRKGKSEGEQVKKVLDDIDKAEKTVNTIKDVIKTVTAVLTSLKAAQKIAEATEKSSTIGASLNPAAAAVAVAQKYVIEGVKKEIKEAEDAVSVAPKVTENFSSFTAETKQKLEKVQQESETKKRLKEERKRKLNS